MPRVPEYSRQVREGAMPGVRQTSAATPGLMGGIQAEQFQKAGQGLQEFGGVMARQQIDEQQQANQVRVNEAMNKAVEAKLKLTYDKDSGFLGLKGKSALERPDGKPLDDEYTERFNQSVSAITDTLGNDAQKLAFRQQTAEMATQFRGSLQQHVAREYGDYQLSVQDGTVKTAQQQMALAWQDPTALAQSKAAIEAAVVETGRLRGWSGQQTQAALVEQMSHGHTAVLAAAVDGQQLEYAREYLKQNTAQMTPEARLSATRVLEAGDFEARTQGAAETLFNNAKGDVAGALAEARAKYKGKEEDAIVTRIKGLDGERVALRERGQKDAADQAWRIYASTGGLGRIPPTVLAAMDGKDLEGLRRTAKADANAASERKEVKTDSSIYYALAAAAATDPKFKDQDLRPFFDKLSPADRKHFIDLQVKVAKPEHAAEVVATGTQINTMVKSLGLKAEQAGMFQQVAEKALFSAQQDKGGKLNQDERQKVLDKLILQGEVLSGHWYQNDPNMRLFEAMAAGKAGQFKPEFSDADRAKATSALIRAGNPRPTQQQIETAIRVRYGIQ